ncbi:uncharacterized protein LOC110944676 [Helianthus annuus]|uniref:uncharacterized protein LOC110944676 n=1 Tax=Helianthus annuus TaxID=4232 RepID=UPI000B9045C0|nr:uncharacterized protein LOC110944676 [Helianthus annuus]
MVHRSVQIGDLACSSCGLEEEDSDHILFLCMWAKAIWLNVWNWLNLTGPDPSSIEAKAIHAVKSLNGSNQWKQLVEVVLFSTMRKIWKYRNSKIFEGRWEAVPKMLDGIKEDSCMD